jgi:multidrug efflux system membrane fusion protein
MKAAGTQRHRPVFRLVSLGIIAAALLLGLFAWRRSVLFPATDDATIDADIVHIASAVGGRIIDLPVEENMLVHKGQVLFRIDPLPYQLAVDQAEADLALAQAQLATQQRAVATQRAAATIAAAEVGKAATNLALAVRTVNRLRPLSAEGYVPVQQLDSAEAAQSDASTALQQAQEQAAAAAAAVDTVAAAAAEVSARQAALAIAQRGFADTVLRAPHDGLVVGLAVSSGEMVAPEQALFTMINREAWFAVGNFRETQLSQIAVGDCATVYSMIDRSVPIAGIVQGVGWGVLDEDRVELPFSVPYVQPSLNWVRVAQRFPVRILLNKPPPRLARLGASAIVEIRHGAACQ